MRDFTWHCGASVLVDDAYATWETKAPTVVDAQSNVIMHIKKQKVLDIGSFDFHMDTREMAIALGNLASDDNKDWEPSKEYIAQLDSVKNTDLYCDLEMIISMANIKGEL